MEVNYLLARLDSFEGIAILTTNLAGSMDRAFKRRLGMRIEFPFPDEATRLRLWRAHIPATMPAADDLGLERLSAAHPMTGAYIRNCVVRAAYLAASASCALSASFLEEAVELEYLDAGRISTSSRLE
jgi:SpoVK/Ycf46/Vps4 family AAA+-type ATPase